ncbi:T9SS type A sorting domain-containing protein [Hymenobacter sp. BT507]|uniref:T9SS type A sorting domain-containing protein n=1 Tax=Hymenobacter citatus TaxID=2763506 RepID=A0ABR7MI33_9BACT|nr:MBG domain-containing protein [Hymenobacter citatus]MBC6610420.1 T9SS type A sorting domain-containing protein [Hymenobacter citatus]
MDTLLLFRKGLLPRTVHKGWLVLLLSLCSAVSAFAQAATVYTDKADYLPGDVVTIEGNGWQAGEQVKLEIDHSTISHGNTVLSATADDNGHILNTEYVIQDIHLGESFTLAATGLSSGLTAQTAFTDGNVISSVTISSQSPASIERGSYATYNVTVISTGSTPNGTSVKLTTPILPKNVTASFSSPTVKIGKGSDATSILTLTSGSSTPIGTNDFTVTATSGTDVASASSTLVITSVSNTALTVSAASGTYGGTTTLVATLTANNTGVSGKQISFKLNNSSVGTATTDATGVATLPNISIAGINASSTAYTGYVAASFAAESGYATSSGTGNLTVSKANQTITVATAAPASATYGSSFTVSATASSGLPITYASTTPLSNSGPAYTMISGTGTGIVKFIQPGNENYNAAHEVTATVAATKANANVAVKGYSGDYDGQPHGATGTATGLNSVNLSNLLSFGASFTDYPGGNANWLFAGDDNYNSKQGTVVIAIHQAVPTFTWAPLTAISYGTTLASSLNAVAEVNGTAVAGTYVYKQGTTVVTDATLLDAQSAAYPLYVYLTPTSSNYTAVIGINSLLVQQADQLITWAQPAAIPYGTALTEIQLNASVAGVTGGSAPGALTYSPVAGAVLAAGPQTLRVTAAATTNYKEATKLVTLQVNQAAQTISFASLPDKTFNDADFELSATASSSLPVSFTVSGSATLLPDGHTVHLTGAGPVTVTSTQTGDNNYLAAPSVSHEFTVKKATTTLSFNNLSQVYTGSPLAPLAYTSDPAGLGGISISYSQNGSDVPAAINAGDYSVMATLNNPNYEAMPVITGFTIQKAAATVTLDALSHIYTGKAQPATATTSAAGSSSFAITYNGATTPPVNAGRYTVVATLLNDNYEGSASGTLVIEPKELTVTADNQQKEYGDQNPALTVRYNGFVDTEDATALPTAPVATTTATQNSGVGSYPITVAGGSAVNYRFTYVAGTLAIRQAELTVTAKAATREYGDLNPTFEATPTGGKNGEKFTTGGTTTADPTSPVGNGYVITPTVSGSTLDNYTVKLVTATLTITPATLTVTANNQTKVYGEDNPTLTGSIKGQKNNETFEFGASTTATASSPVSGPGVSYGIVPTAKGATFSNYNVHTVEGVLTITARPITLTVDAGQTKVYGDNDPATFTYTVGGSGLAPSDVFAGALTRAAGNNVGAYAIGQGTLSIQNSTTKASTIGNYTVTYTSSDFAITPKAVTVTPLAGQSKVYGTADPALAYEKVTLVGNDAFAGSLAREAGSKVGSYSILQGTLALSNNYTLRFTDGVKFNITARPLLVTATSINKEFDNTTAATVTLADNRVAGDQLTTAYANAAFADPNVGMGKLVSVTGISISGPAADNYTANASTNTTAAITAATTKLTVVSNGPVQYSDQVTFTATATSATAQTVLNATGGTVEFKLSNSAGTATVSLGSSAYPADWNNGIVTKSFKIVQPAGTYTVAAVFTPASSNLAGVTNTTAGMLVVDAEDAEVAYAGLEYFGTANSTSNLAKVEYIATFKDKADNFPGNITKSTAAFKESAGTLLFGQTFPVLALNAADLTAGVGRSGVRDVTLNNQEMSYGGKTFNLITETQGTAQGTYYAGSTPDYTLITIAVPGQDFVNGGGNTVVAQSGGTYMATAGSKMNFGFTMKWNKSGKNIQGQATVIFRRLVGDVWRTYQIKSSAINTLGTSSTTAGNQGDFNTKANLTDITDPLNIVNIGGNLDLSVQAFESTVTGGAHKIGVTLRSSSGELLFSNNWTGTKTAMQDLKGGKISVRSSTSLSATSTTQSVVVTDGSAAAATAQAGKNSLEIYPNPLVDNGTIRFQAQKAGRAQVVVFDGLGRQVATLYDGQVAAGEEQSVSFSRASLPNGAYFFRLLTDGSVENKRVIIAK